MSQISKSQFHIKRHFLDQNPKHQSQNITNEDTHGQRQLLFLLALAKGNHMRESHRKKKRKKLAEASLFESEDDKQTQKCKKQRLYYQNQRYKRNDQP